MAAAKKILWQLASFYARLWGANKKIKDVPVRNILGSVRLSGEKNFSFWLFFVPLRERRGGEVFCFHWFIRLVLHYSNTSAESFSGYWWSRWNINGLRKIRCNLLPFCHFTVIRFLGAASSWFFQQSRIIFYSWQPSPSLPQNLRAHWPDLWGGALSLHCASISPVLPTLCSPPRHSAQSKSNTSG